MQDEIFRVNNYELPVLNGINKLKLPYDCEVLGVIVKDTEPGGNIVRLLVAEPALPSGEVAKKADERFLVVNDNSPYGNILEEDEELMYVGTAVWDNAYRINHVFRILDWGFEDEEAGTTDDDGYEESVAVEEPLIEQDDKVDTRPEENKE